jgi:hypothetical protein
MANLKKEYIFAFLIIIAAGMALMTLSGALFSGYHFMECHHYTECKEVIRHSWYDFLANCVESEFGSRFRPLYYLNLLVETWLFGDNLLLQGLWHIIQNIIVAFLLYLLGRKINWTHQESLLLAGLTLIGTQSAIFYQTTTIETTGLTFCVVSLYLLVPVIQGKRYRPLLYTGSILSFICMVLIKENFILMLPASYIFYCMIYDEKHGTGFIKTLLKTWKTGVLLLLLTAISLGVVAFLTQAGTGFGYAGMDYNVGVNLYIKATLYLYGISGCAILAFIGAIYLWSRKMIDKTWIFPLLLFLAITIPQILIHTKSGIIDRYLIPAMLGCAYFALFVYRKLKETDKNVNIRLWGKLSGIIGGIGIIVCGFILYDKTIQNKLVDFAFHIQGQTLQDITTVSSLQYLLSTISTMAIVSLTTSAALLVWGFWRKKYTVLKSSQLFLGSLIIILILDFGLAFASCQRYAMRGFATEKFLNTIVDNSDVDDSILIVGNPMKETEGLSVGLKTYLNKYNRTNLLVYPIANNAVEEALAKGLLDYYKDVNTIANKNAIRAIAIFSGQEEPFLASAEWFDSTQYSRYEFTGNYIVYVQK